MSTEMRAKFKIDKIERTEHSETLTMSAVYGGDKNAEDNTFSAATPSAELKMTITNKALWGKYYPGQKFYADFSLAAN